MNKTIGISVLLLIILGGAGYFGWKSFQVAAPVTAPVVPTETQALNPAVEAVLTDRMKLAGELSKDAIISEAIKAESVRNAKLSKEEIAKLDADWKNSKGTGPFVEQFMANPASTRLKEFQVAHPEFKEIFVTDIYGLNVTQTNKTSDYLQSDEEWWTKAYGGGTGFSYHGDIEFDESAQTEAIALYVPVMGDDAHAIGVIKAVLDLTAIKKAI